MTVRVNAIDAEISIPTQYIAKLSGLIEGIPGKPAAPKAMALTLNKAMTALEMPAPIMADMKG